MLCVLQARKCAKSVRLEHMHQKCLCSACVLDRPIYALHKFQCTQATCCFVFCCFVVFVLFCFLSRSHMGV